MSESMSSRSATDAVLILEALARVLQSSPHAITKEFQDDHVQDVQAAAAAVVQAAKLDAQEITGARLYGGSEWDSALLNILFPDDQVVDVYNRIQSGPKTTG